MMYSCSVPTLKEWTAYNNLQNKKEKEREKGEKIKKKMSIVSKQKKHTTQFLFDKGILLRLKKKKNTNKV